MVSGKAGMFLMLVLLGLSGLGQAAQPVPGGGSSGQKPILVIDSGGHTARINQILFTHDGHYLVSAGDGKVARVWSLDSGETVRTFRVQMQPGSEGKIFAAALSPDDRYLALGGFFSPHDIRLYNFQTGEMVAAFHGHADIVHSLAFSPDGGMLVSASYDKTVRLWDVANRKSLHVLGGHSDVVYTVAFSPDGLRVVSGSWDHTLRLWDAKSGKLIREMQGHEKKVLSAAFSGDRRYIASGSEDRCIRLWDATTGDFVKELSRGEDLVDGLAFTPDGQRLLVRHAQTVTVVSVPAGEVLTRFEHHDNLISAMAVSPEGHVAASGGGNVSEIYLWDTETGAMIRKLVGHGRPVWSVGFAQDGRSIAFGTTSQFQGLNDGGPLENTLILDHGNELGVSLERKVVESFQRALDRFGTYQLKTKSGNDDPVLQVLRDGKVIREITRDPSYDHRSFTWINDGQQFVSGGGNGCLTLYDSQTGEKIRDLVGHTGDVWAVAPSPDGKRLVSGSDDQTIRLWDLATGANLLTVFVANDGEWVAWTPQGYYTSSLHGDRYFGWHVNQGADRAAMYYPAAQFQQQFYRPDVVAEYLKDGDIEKALAHANARRGPSTILATPVASIAAILPPRIYIAEPGQDVRVVEKENLHVKAAAFSNNLPITDLRVMVNGAQVAGLPEGNAKGDPLEREVEAEVTLRPGDNVLVFQAAHAKARSEERTRTVTYRPPPGTHPAAPAKPNLILLAIGISDYTDPALHLSWATEDARQIYDQFKRQEGKLFEHVEARLLPEEKARASRSEILNSLDWFEGQGTTGDVKVLFLSGHGTLDRHRNFYFLSQDQTAAGNPELEGIPWNRLLSSLTAGAGRPVLMVDACHAAAAKGVPRGRVDMTEVVKRANGDYPGVMMFAASTSDELSVEREEWKHGAFTQALLEGLAGKADGIDGAPKDGRVDSFELSVWLHRRVAELTGKQQNANFEPGGEVPVTLFQVEP
jgi:WD40 repeat protein